MPKEKITIVPREAIQSKIFVLRGKKVMLDRDLAMLYEVPTKRFNEQVKRNIKRFPEEFMFQLTDAEFKSLRSQFATSNRGGRRYLPYCFTEHGVAMLSSVLNSERAIQINIQIIKAFVKMREMLINYQELKQKIEDMEQKVDKRYKISSVLFEEVFKEMEKVKRLLAPPKEPQKDEIGFKPSRRK
ncbi:ORF6N domain-containing protein [Patescibacteria group bacterium]